MKCQVCGIEIDVEIETDPDRVAALTVVTNRKEGYPIAQKQDDPFIGIFAIWNQRTKSHLILCGACLCERIMWMDQPVGKIEKEPITTIYSDTPEYTLPRQPIDEK